MTNGSFYSFKASNIFKRWKSHCPLLPSLKPSPLGRFGNTKQINFPALQGGQEFGVNTCRLRPLQILGHSSAEPKIGILINRLGHKAASTWRFDGALNRARLYQLYRNSRYSQDHARLPYISKATLHPVTHLAPENLGRQWQMQGMPVPPQKPPFRCCRST